MRRLLHIHWRRPDGPVEGPFALSRSGALGRRTYRCRCGQKWARPEFLREPRWRPIQEDR